MPEALESQQPKPLPKNATEAATAIEEIFADLESLYEQTATRTTCPECGRILDGGGVQVKLVSALADRAHAEMGRAQAALGLLRAQK